MRGPVVMVAALFMRLRWPGLGSVCDRDGDRGRGWEVTMRLGKAEHTEHYTGFRGRVGAARCLTCMHPSSCGVAASCSESAQYPGCGWRGRCKVGGQMTFPLRLNQRARDDE